MLIYVWRHVACQIKKLIMYVCSSSCRNIEHISNESMLDHISSQILLVRCSACVIEHISSSLINGWKEKKMCPLSNSNPFCRNTKRGLESVIIIHPMYVSIAHVHLYTYSYFTSRSSICLTTYAKLFFFSFLSRDQIATYMCKHITCIHLRSSLFDEILHRLMCSQLMDNVCILLYWWLNILASI